MVSGSDIKKTLCLYFSENVLSFRNFTPSVISEHRESGRNAYLVLTISLRQETVLSSKYPEASKLIISESYYRVPFVDGSGGGDIDAHFHMENRHGRVLYEDSFDSETVLAKILADVFPSIEVAADRAALMLMFGLIKTYTVDSIVDWQDDCQERIHLVLKLVEKMYSKSYTKLKNVVLAYTQKMMRNLFRLLFDKISDMVLIADNSIIPDEPLSLKVSVDRKILENILHRLIKIEEQITDEGSKKQLSDVLIELNGIKDGGDA